MTDIFHTTFSTAFSLMNIFEFQTQIDWNLFPRVQLTIAIWLKFVPKGPIDNNTVLVQVMACCRTCDKPLSEPMMARVGDAYVYHSTSELALIQIWDISMSQGVNMYSTYKR